MSEPTPVSESNPPVPRPEGLAPNVAAGLACLFSLVSGAVFLVVERKNKFVRFWAMQSLLLGVGAIAVALVVAIAGPVFDWLPIIGIVLKLVVKFLNGVFQVSWVVVYFICLIKAFSNKEWEIPGIGKFARRLLLRMDGAPPPIE